MITNQKIAHQYKHIGKAQEDQEIWEKMKKANQIITIKNKI